jgi:hypothetical protein
VSRRGPAEGRGEALEAQRLRQHVVHAGLPAAFRIFRRGGRRERDDGLPPVPSAHLPGRLVAVELEPAGFDLREVEHVVDDGEQGSAAPTSPSRPPRRTRSNAATTSTSTTVVYEADERLPPRTCRAAWGSAADPMINARATNFRRRRCSSRLRADAFAGNHHPITASIVTRNAE